MGYIWDIYLIINCCPILNIDDNKLLSFIILSTVVLYLLAIEYKVSPL